MKQEVRRSFLTTDIPMKQCEHCGYALTAVGSDYYAAVEFYRPSVLLRYLIRHTADTPTSDLWVNGFTSLRISNAYLRGYLMEKVLGVF